MPSPFPGMDPYLEAPYWRTVLFSLNYEILRYLAPRLRPHYIVFTHRWSILDTLPPDISNLPSRTPHYALKILDLATRQAVTIIQLLSPLTKSSEWHNRYLQKRHRILLGKANLLEIDLLRQGQRVPMREQLPNYPYFVFLSRYEQRPFTEVWPIGLREPLPTIPVPLLAGDNDVPLDLQAVFTANYDIAGYDLVFDYTHPPEIPLTGEDAVWAEERLRAAGLRE